MRKTVTAVVSIAEGTHRARVLARRDELIASTCPPNRLGLVESIARQIRRSLPPSFELDDLIGVGNLALTAAANRFRPDQHGGCPFEPYARQVVRGAILDSVRRRNWTENMHEPIQISSDDVAKGGAGSTEANRERERPALMRLATVPRIIEIIDLRQRSAILAEAMSWLTAGERQILDECFSPWEPTTAEVAARLGLSRHQVDRRREAALRSLRARLKRAA
jgi:RNA polymerase sigma factor (sigma-70 family)